MAKSIVQRMPIRVERTPREVSREAKTEVEPMLEKKKVSFITKSGKRVSFNAAPKRKTPARKTSKQRTPVLEIAEELAKDVIISHVVPHGVHHHIKTIKTAQKLIKRLRASRRKK